MKRAEPPRVSRRPQHRLGAVKPQAWPNGSTALRRILLMACIGCAAQAVRADVLHLSPDRASYPLLSYQQVLIDPGGRLDFDQVRARSNEFRAFRNIPGFRYQDVVVWVRFSVAGTELPGDGWLLHVDNKSLDEITFFRWLDGDSGDVVHTGDASPFHTREVPSRSFYFYVPVSEEPRTFYLRAASKGPLYVPLKVVRQSAYWSTATASTLVMGIFFGSLLVMALYHLVLFLSIRDRAYLFYVLFIGALLMYVVAVERVGFEYLWPDALWWAERSNTVLGLVAVLAGILFSRSFLDAHRYARRWNRALVVLAACGTALVVANLVGMMSWLIYLTISFIICCLVVLIVTGVIVHRRGNASAKYYLIAWSFLFAGALVWTLGYLQLLPPSGFVRSYSVQMGASAEIVLFALGLGHRYNEMRTAREQLRVRIANDLHDDVGSSLTGLALSSERLALAIHGSAASLAHEIAGRARMLSHVMRDIVWAQDPDQQDWEALELRMKDYAVQLLSEKRVAFDFDAGTAPDHRRPPDTVRQNLILFFKEALHNAVKHADCSRVETQWQFDPGRLRVTIADDGRGFDPSAVRGGMGLKGMRRRAAAMRAAVDIRSAPGSGTTIVLDVPLDSRQNHALS